jgi:hypothetical protein
VSRYAAGFAPDYAASREGFLALCRERGARVRSFHHPRTGPGGEPLAVDVARFGPAPARRMFIVSSGTHGIEGFCGAGVQHALLSAGLQRELPPETGVAFVHGVNPFGFAWRRRTDEDNVDLNRNFLDHGAGAYPDDSIYNEVHALLLPGDWDGPGRRTAEEGLRRYVAERGARALQAAACRGQYSHADGLFYGGRRAAWAADTWRTILRELAGASRCVAVLDLHSGLGARGASELISGARLNTREHELARLFFGDELVFPGLNSTAPPAFGYMGESLAQTLPHVPGALVVAEYGTVPFEDILEILRADNFVHARDRPGSRLWREVKDGMRAAFVGDDAAWQEMVVERGVAIWRRCLDGLAAFPPD